MCNCKAVLLNNPNYRFRHYVAEEDVLGSEFDDFGTEVYEDEAGQLHTFYVHDHKGMIYSYRHIMNYEEIPQNLQYVEYKRDNSLIPQIIELMKTLPDPKPEPKPQNRNKNKNRNSNRNNNSNKNTNQQRERNHNQNLPTETFTLADYIKPPKK